MFLRLGKVVLRYWPAVVAAWAAALLALLLWAPSIRSVQKNDDVSFLPANQPSRRAADAIRDSFHMPPAMSVAAIVMEREGGLTGAIESTTQPADPSNDWAYVRRLTDRLMREGGRRNWEVLSPADPQKPFLRTMLTARDAGRQTADAAVIKVGLPAGFVSAEAIADVEWIERTVRQANPPGGLNLAITGSASYGRDYFEATETSLDRTTWVTVVAVIVILLLTYRALPAAAISLITVTVAVVVSVSLVAIGGALGWSVSMIVELFAIVIGYGAGVDFSLFFLSRYHEELGRVGPRPSRADLGEAIVRALRGTGPAIVASAGTVAAGLALMYLARFKVFSTAGPAVATSVVVSCLASLTLTPALAYLTGTATFWPRRLAVEANGARQGRGFWNRLADFAVRRPLLILLVGLLALIPLAVLGWSQEVVYDTLADLPASRQSVRGADIFFRHFPRGEMSPIRVLVRTGRSLSNIQWARVADAVDRQLDAREEVQQVRSLVHPLGLKSDIAFTAEILDERNDKAWNGFIRRTLREEFAEQVAPRHIAKDGQAALWEVAIDLPPYSNAALANLDSLAQTIRDAVGSVKFADDVKPAVLLAGDTAQMRDLQEVTDRDFWVVGGLVVVAIIAIVVLVIRDLPVALFVMLATILTYGAALGLTAWGFRWAFGTPGPDWKVEFFLFIILVAVGQDYNLFILTRITEERRFFPLTRATGVAIARTGAIISCCGLIMAATLGSLASSPLRLLQELGVAFVIGLLIDTFLVRPLMVPAFVLLFRRLNRGAAPAAAAPPPKLEADPSRLAAGPKGRAP